MTHPMKQATGFFRFPARITTRLVLRSVQVVRAEPIGNHAAREFFHLRHGDAEPPKTVPVHDRVIVAQVRGVVARITLRV